VAANRGGRKSLRNLFSHLTTELVLTVAINCIWPLHFCASGGYADAIIEHEAQLFDFYDGGGWHIALFGIGAGRGYQQRQLLNALVTYWSKSWANDPRGFIVIHHFQVLRKSYFFCSTPLGEWRLNGLRQSGKQYPVLQDRLRCTKLLLTAV